MEEGGSLARLHYLDALRAFAMVLVIPFHAANFFAIRGQGGTLLSGWIWTTHAFRMPLFFLIAGLFGAGMVERRGSGPWLRGRLTRLGIPLIVGVLALIPLSAITATWGLEADRDHSVLANLTHPRPEYLWFLWYLLIIIAAWLPLRAAFWRWGAQPSIHDRLHRFAASGWALPLLALPTALALWSTGEWAAYPRGGEFTFPPGLLAYYAIFFAFGWVLGGRMANLESLWGRPNRRLVMAAAAALPAFWLFAHAGDPGIAPSSAIRLGALYLGALCSWLFIAGLVGLFRRHLSGERPRLRYVADASYWIYLSHMPFLAPLQLLLIGSIVPGPAQFVLAVAVTFAMTLLTYHLFVRYSTIGRVLHGPLRRPASIEEIEWRDRRVSRRATAATPGA